MQSTDTVPRPDVLALIWQNGFSIAELWGFKGPVARGVSETPAEHALIWGILGIAEYQVSKGFGHRYLRERLWKGEWIAIGVLGARVENSQLTLVPKFEHAKFGSKISAIGDGTTTQYTDVRVVHAAFFNEVVNAQNASGGGEDTTDRLRESDEGNKVG